MCLLNLTRRWKGVKNHSVRETLLVFYILFVVQEGREWGRRDLELYIQTSWLCPFSLLSFVYFVFCFQLRNKTWKSSLLLCTFWLLDAWRGAPAIWLMCLLVRVRTSLVWVASGTSRGRGIETACFMDTLRRTKGGMSWCVCRGKVDSANSFLPSLNFLSWAAEDLSVLWGDNKALSE